MILIDNYDSFTYNIVQYLLELGCHVDVYENDKITVTELKQKEFDCIILAPGPGNPDNAGISLDVIKEFYKQKKILGICLGHQCIAQFFGGNIKMTQQPVHGKVSKIYHNNSDLFCGIPNGFEAVRYHSLVAENFPECLIQTAKTSDGINMALQHKTYPLYGVQFHPEAILTQYGHKLLQNFISI